MDLSYNRKKPPGVKNAVADCLAEWNSTRSRPLDSRERSIFVEVPGASFRDSQRGGLQKTKGCEPLAGMVSKTSFFGPLLFVKVLHSS